MRIFFSPLTVRSTGTSSSFAASFFFAASAFALAFSGSTAQRFGSLSFGLSLPFAARLSAFLLVFSPSPPAASAPAAAAPAAAPALRFSWPFASARKQRIAVLISSAEILSIISALEIAHEREIALARVEPLAASEN